MKKIILKKQSYEEQKNRIGYKVAYEKDLNPSQFEAVIHSTGPALVIAGAGTGKTRTLIYRLSRLVEDGVPPENICLLTFTRKSSAEMLRRASTMLDGRCEKVSGGTFHSFALQLLRLYANQVGYDLNFTMLDQSDSEDTINMLRSQLNVNKTKRRFPKKETLSKIFNLSTNRLTSVEEMIVTDFPFFIDSIDDICSLYIKYNEYKRKYNLMDYDDLLLNTSLLLKEHPKIKEEITGKIKYLMVDEYQDTNKLQHDIIKHLAGTHRNVMAVGDDAQSIYSFRGAEFQNIIEFPNDFEGCKVYKIEENYRSTQPILTLTNRIIENAHFSYQKELYSHREDLTLPKIITAENERQQSLFVAQQILELREEGYSLKDIAVLFRSSYHSFDLEVELNKSNIPYIKYGGLKFIETAHIKDVIAFFKVLYNPQDVISWHRILLLLEGVGPRTASKFIDSISENKNIYGGDLSINYAVKGSEAIRKLLEFVKDLNGSKLGIGQKAAIISDFYRPMLTSKYDDWQKRYKDLETFNLVAERYKNIDDFINDMAIEPPTESVIDVEPDSKEEEFLSLSTIHSAKGLEWRAVFLVWALDGRFPSAKSVDTLENIEEERRLFYVACTRAKDQLFISYPINIYDRESGKVLSKSSRFLDGIDDSLADFFVLEEWDQNSN